MITRTESYPILMYLITLLFHILFASNGKTQSISKYSETGYYILSRQSDLSWVLRNDTNAKTLIIQDFEINDGYVLKNKGIDSIPDSIYMLKRLQELSIMGNNHFVSISKKLSELPKLETIEFHGFGDTFMLPDIPILSHVKNATILLSDSLAIHKILHACPNLHHLELHLEAYTHWSFTDMLQYNPKLKVLTISWWEGNPPKSNRKYTVLGDESWGYDTMGIHYQYIDLDLSHCKHLRRIETDYKLSPEMQKYCRRHWIRVVKFSRKRFWRKKD